MWARVIAGVVAALWSLFVFPPQFVDWAGPSAVPDWVRAMDGWPVYRAVEDAFAGIGWTDVYVLWGVAIVPAVLLAWWAMHRTLRGFGVWGLALSMVWLLVAPVTTLSYLNHEEGAPLRFMWGAEAFVLMAAFVLAIVVAFTGRHRDIRPVTRALVGCSVVFGVLGTLLTGYYPHGTYIGIGVLAALIAGTAGRREGATTGV